MAKTLRGLATAAGDLLDRTVAITNAYEAMQRRRSAARTFEKYRLDPAGYSRDVLRTDLTPDQEAMLLGMVQPPFRVLARAGHTVGKSKAAAIATSWLYDTRDPCMILTTAPRLDSVRKIIWRELHSMRSAAGLGGFKTHASLELSSSPNHFALGMTARNTYGFHGKHELRSFIILDEATGVEPEFWEAADSMLNGLEYGLLAIYNPFSTATKAYEEEGKGPGRNRVVVMSCLDHPNVLAELRGEPAPHPAAVRLEWVCNALKDWSDVVREEDADPIKGDVLWPPRSLRQVRANLADLPVHPDVHARYGEPTWYRPGPLAQIRVKGEWPSSGINTIWTEALWNRARAERVELKENWRTAVGCDVARFGDDMTVIVVRRGPCVVHAEEHGGWDTGKTAARLKALCQEYRGPEAAARVRVFVDEPGLGAGVLDQAHGFNFIGVNPSSRSAVGAAVVEMMSLGRTTTEFSYANVRAQLWFDVANMARRGGLVDLSRLSGHQAAELKRQLMAQTYGFRETDGAVVLTPKDDVKELIKRSPDFADALNLAFCRVGTAKEKVSLMR